MTFSRRPTWAFDFVIVVCCAFVLLTLGAMALYPGGTSLDGGAHGYRFFENFFSDLGRTVARGNGRPNPFGSLLFFTALASAGAALGVFWVSFARFFWNGLAQRIATVAGTFFGLLCAANFVGIALTPANIYPREHVHHVFAAFEAFPLAVLCFGAAMLLGRSFPKAGALIFAAFFAVLLAYLKLITTGPAPDSASGLMIQAGGQKLVVYASLLSIGAQSWVARRHLAATAPAHLG